jgi:hypothetical protein
MNREKPAGEAGLATAGEVLIMKNQKGVSSKNDLHFSRLTAFYSN